MLRCSLFWDERKCFLLDFINDKKKMSTSERIPPIPKFIEFCLTHSLPPPPSN